MITSTSITRPASPTALENGGASESTKTILELHGATRVEVDLTIDDNDGDDVIVVKSEIMDRKDSRSSFGTDDSMEDLKYELREIEREKRKLELEAKEERIKRKIAKCEALKERKVKEEIKIED